MPCIVAAEHMYPRKYDLQQALKGAALGEDTWSGCAITEELVALQAVEQSERPWLILLTSMSALSAVLLALVFWKLHGFH